MEEKVFKPGTCVTTLTFLGNGRVLDSFSKRQSVWLDDRASEKKLYADEAGKNPGVREAGELRLILHEKGTMARLGKGERRLKRDVISENARV